MSAPQNHYLQARVPLRGGEDTQYQAKGSL
jgi:hypothetical protein